MIRQNDFQNSLEGGIYKFEQNFSPEEPFRAVNNSNLPNFSDRKVLDYPEISNQEIALVGLGSYQALEFLSELDSASESKRDRELVSSTISKHGADIFDTFYEVYRNPARAYVTQDELKFVNSLQKGAVFDALDEMELIEEKDLTGSPYQVKDSLTDYKDVFYLSRAVENV
jgi:hypothetical protein